MSDRRYKSGRAKKTTQRALLMAVRLAWRRHGKGGPGDLGGTMNIANAVGRARKLGVPEGEIERAKREAMGFKQYRPPRRDPTAKKVWTEHRGVGPSGPHVYWKRGSYVIFPHKDGFLLHDWSGASFGVYPTLRAAQRRAGTADRVIRGQSTLTRAEMARLSRRDPAMTARRAGVIERANEAHERARRAHDERRFLKGGGYTPDEVRVIAHRAGLKKPPSNRALGHLEAHRFMASPPDKLFAYYKEGAKVGTPITTWPGQVLGHVVWRGQEVRKMGGKSVAVRVAGKNGFLYVGTCNLTGGDYCRLRKSKPLTEVHGDIRRHRLDPAHKRARHALRHTRGRRR